MPAGATQFAGLISSLHYSLHSCSRGYGPQATRHTRITRGNHPGDAIHSALQRRHIRPKQPCVKGGNRHGGHAGLTPPLAIAHIRPGNLTDNGRPIVPMADRGVTRPFSPWRTLAPETIPAHRAAGIPCVQKFLISRLKPLYKALGDRYIPPIRMAGDVCCVVLC